MSCFSKIFWFTRSRNMLEASFIKLIFVNKICIFCQHKFFNSFFVFNKWIASTISRPRLFWMSFWHKFITCQQTFVHSFISFLYSTIFCFQKSLNLNFQVFFTLYTITLHVLLYKIQLMKNWDTKISSLSLCFIFSENDQHILIFLWFFHFLSFFYTLKNKSTFVFIIIFFPCLPFKNPSFFLETQTAYIDFCAVNLFTTCFGMIDLLFVIYLHFKQYVFRFSMYALEGPGGSL